MMVPFEVREEVRTSVGAINEVPQNKGFEAETQVH